MAIIRCRPAGPVRESEIDIEKYEQEAFVECTKMVIHDLLQRVDKLEQIQLEILIELRRRSKAPRLERVSGTKEVKPQTPRPTTSGTKETKPQGPVEKSGESLSRLEATKPVAPLRPAVKATKAACKNGHPWTPENIVERTGRDGKVNKQCRPCEEAANELGRKERAEAEERRRNATHCPKGHEYTEETVYLRPNTGDTLSRYCLTCRNESRAAHGMPTFTREQAEADGREVFEKLLAEKQAAGTV